MLNDARVASACSYVRTCRRVRNSKKIATIRDFICLHPRQLDYEMGPLRTIQERRENGVIRAAHPHTPILGQCPLGAFPHSFCHENDRKRCRIDHLDGIGHFIFFIFYFFFFLRRHRKSARGVLGLPPL